MIILSIETSCDETGAAVVRKYSHGSLEVLSNTVSTSLSLHAQTGGIIPEIAAREQIKFILPVIDDALQKGLSHSLSSEQTPPIDALAITYGPGLIGSLLVGTETVRTLAFLWDKPIIPVNHLYGHIYANWIERDDITFPALSLVVSGGHTDLVLMKSHTDVSVIGGTRDDAAGEAFDKIGRLLSLPYPAGPVISKLALRGNPKAFQFPRPMIGSDDFDFSFSGLKTSVLNTIKREGWTFQDEAFVLAHQELLSDLAASVQAAIVDVLVKKTIKAAHHYKVSSVLLGGGVAANKLLRDSLEQNVTLELPHALFAVPKMEYCTDNAAMIAAAAAFNPSRISWKDLTADPELYY